ncbi:DUF4191 domain-containing protein [Schumannella luteola]|uniref:Putative integral membrane protein n=1 Tax=Schumannella luteola TaxID=472059 RepID=A0A852YQ50_9MICO|nr:DUF4191 domain-containing protein [Schumannella luteola]NYG99859.1 putative integral membrane protein [Schumannella luteola]TPX02208.1 DUF4191 family protein [Schumannella luteola]
MARTTTPAKEPGRIRQMWNVFKMTRRYDPLVVWYLLIAFIVPVAAGIVIALLISRDQILGLVLYILAGVLLGVLLAMIVLGRRAEKAAYSQIAGQPGAVGSVIKSGLRRGWTGTEMPVNISPRTQDAVYRVVGRGGIVLIGEGPQNRTQRMLEEERKKVQRIVPNVEVHFVYVGPDADSVPLHRLASKLTRFKRALTTAEISAVSNRLASLARTPGGIGIPKGMDPTKVRAPRPR